MERHQLHLELKVGKVSLFLFCVQRKLKILLELESLLQLGGNSSMSKRSNDLCLISSLTPEQARKDQVYL